MDAADVRLVGCGICRLRVGRVALGGATYSIRLPPTTIPLPQLPHHDPLCIGVPRVKVDRTLALITGVITLTESRIDLREPKVALGPTRIGRNASLGVIQGTGTLIQVELARNHIRENLRG